MNINARDHIINRLCIIHGQSKEKATIIYNDYIHLISHRIAVGEFSPKEDTWAIWDAYQADQKKKQEAKL